LWVPFVLVTSATVVAVRRIPNQYRSETLVLIVPQQVPENYVQPTVNVRLEDRLASINQLILSRTRLEQLVNEFNLYATERQTQLMADVIDRMRARDIRVETTGTGSSDRRQSSAATFRISYTGGNPRTVMNVTERLASLFIEESLRDRTALAEGTNQFLETQLQEARNRLIEQEKRLEVYREQHAGELPSQLNTNMQAIQNIQLQLQTLTQSLSQDRDRHQMVERLVAEADAFAPVSPPPPPVAARPPEPGAPNTLPAAQQLEGARAELRALELRLKPTHPDLARMKRVIARLELKAESEALEQPLSPPAPVADTVQISIAPQELQRQARLRDLAAERDSLPRRISAKEAEEARLREVLNAYQGRIAAVPARETELVELTRDYETLRQVYTSLLAKNENARASANLERRQIGEQFKVLEPARLPERPISPNRRQIDAMGALGGLALGLGLVLVVDYRDRSLRTEADVLSAFSLPVLALVPTMMGALERQHRQRVVRLVVAASALALGLVIAWRFGLVGRWL